MSRTRSATFTASIQTWAAAIQPGSPAPLSPATPMSSKSVYTPSSAHQFDLTALGYTSVFVHLPTTPSTPQYLRDNNDNNRYPTPPTNPTENNNCTKDNNDPCVTRKDNKASLDITPSSPSHGSRHRNPLASVLPHTRTRSKSMSHSNIVPAKSKSSKRQQQQLPPSLMNELLLLQFTSGGKLDAHVARAMEHGAVSDGKGGVWWDQQDQMEYQSLVPKQKPRKEKQSSKEKKRPAPLNLGRQEFVDASFIPSPSAPIPVQKKSGFRAFFSRAS
ncbi:hypothetical protein CPB85DRAFT_353446 [Mucidula mucida]|nr:hypothetical protein CPB85DRAFT_353446 [Mucidula mucida]